MNDDELKQLWQQQSLRQPQLSSAQLIAAMQKQTAQLRRILDSRDIRELVACAVVVIIFAVYFFTAREPLSRLGNLIVIASTFFIAWKLVRTRRSTPPAPPGASVVESLRAELKSVRAQSRLLGSVLWWYLLPPTIGLLVGTWGTQINLHAKITSTLVFIAVDVFVWWLNRWARSKQLLPAQAQLESLLHSIETGQPWDQASLAGLRPIVLSMTAAGQVKPVEFKVAFWQIALWAEVGFIGIWFFLMLALAVHNPGSSKTKAQTRVTVAQGVPFEETNRYSIAARKIIALLNAGDYTAVYKLYNPQMSQAFPPQETSDFYARLTAAFGTIENVEGPTGNGYRGWTAFLLRCRHGELTMSLAVDADDRISGIYFRPTHKSLGNLQQLVAGIFSWQHLAWFPLFFLGGLGYSRILQNKTERAVGISALGVHLHKGQNLILWDDINEVRPLRILNIRSLWLIKESGERTITPWTSLERHTDLKAAVEDFAPANHPIRKYLSLLKRI